MIAATIPMRGAICLLASLGLLASLSPAAAHGEDERPMRLAIAGLVHGHVEGFFRAAKNRPGVVERVKPEAVAAFTSTYDHPQVVQACARRRIHVMMEKPLAVSVEHARAIQHAAETGGIHVIVNYETTWYPSHGALVELPADERDSLSYLAAVVRGRLKPSGLSSLENNLVVTEILEAARESARSGRTIRIAPR